MGSYCTSAKSTTPIWWVNMTRAVTTLTTVEELACAYITRACHLLHIHADASCKPSAHILLCTNILRQPTVITGYFHRTIRSLSCTKGSETRSRKYSLAVRSNIFNTSRCDHIFQVLLIYL